MNSLAGDLLFIPSWLLLVTGGEEGAGVVTTHLKLLLIYEGLEVISKLKKKL